MFTKKKTNMKIKFLNKNKYTRPFMGGLDYLVC